MAEFSIEVCDAWPGYVEENLETWMNEVGLFCPWASRVVREAAEAIDEPQHIRHRNVRDREGSHQPMAVRQYCLQVF